MSKLLITISREYGSGGLLVGQELAEALGLPCYDKKLLTIAAEKSGFSEEMLRQAESRATNSLLYSLATSLGVGAFGPDTLSLYDKLYLAQFDVIRQVADEGSCVIVGRCADYILEDIPNHLNVYVYAPDESRLKNCVENLQMDPQTAKKMMRDVDAARNRYHKAYIPGWQSVFDHKDLMIDSSRFGIDGTAKILADIVKNQWG